MAADQRTIFTVRKPPCRMAGLIGLFMVGSLVDGSGVRRGFHSSAVQGAVMMLLIHARLEEMRVT